MARGGAQVQDEGVEDIVDDGTEAVDASVEGTEEKPAKAKKEPARGDLPEGYTTPVGLAKLLSQPKDGNAENTDPSNWYHTARDGSHEVKPQMVYSYIKNAGKDHPFPLETVTDSIGKERQALLASAGLQWWDEKNQRVGERAANAKAKAEAKASKAAKSEDGEDAAGDVEEAE